MAVTVSNTTGGTAAPFLGRVGSITGGPNLQSGSYTLAFRVRFTALTTTDNPLWLSITDSNANGLGGFYIGRFGGDPAGQIVATRVSNGFGTSQVAVSATGYSSTTAWVHVCGTYDGTTIRIYINGVQTGSIASATTTCPNVAVAQLISLGAGQAEAVDSCFFSRALTAEEVQQLSARRGIGPLMRGDCFGYYPMTAQTLTDCGLDYSGKANNCTLQQSGTGNPVQSSGSVPVAWGSGNTHRLYIPASSVAAQGTGQVTFNGAGTQTAAAAKSGTGLTVFNASGNETVAVAESSNGQTVFNASGAQTAAVAKVVDGRTVFDGAATSTAAVAKVADGRTLFNGSGAASVSAADAADGRTVFNASATATVSVAAVGDGRTVFNASASGGTSGIGQTTFNGSATATVSVATTADGRTVFNGTSTATSSTGSAAQGDGRTVFNASATATVTVAAVANGRSVFNGTSFASAAVPFVDIRQRVSVIPRATRWMYTDPLQPVDYASVLGAKLVDYWHSEVGISLDGSFNVQSWTGRNGLVLGQSNASLRPTYGVDGSNFAGRNVVQCTFAGRCLTYDPGTPIFSSADRPAIVHVSRRRAQAATAIIINLENAGPTTRLEDRDSNTLTRVRSHSFASGPTIVLTGADVALEQQMCAFGLANDRFQVAINGQVTQDVMALSPVAPATRFGVGARGNGSVGSDSSFAMAFLCRTMPNAFELLQLYYLAKSEWGV